MNWPRLNVPIISDLSRAKWPAWRDALIELFVILFFSLMPLWLGLLITGILTFPENRPTFLEKFASSSDLGIISAALLGPLLYAIFRDDGAMVRDRFSAKFPSGLWFVIGILLCCLVATVIYSLTYVSGARAFFDQQGHYIEFVNAAAVRTLSWLVFVVAILLVLSLATIRNSMGSAALLMGDDANDLTSRLRAQLEGEADQLAQGLHEHSGEGQ